MYNLNLMVLGVNLESQPSYISLWEINMYVCLFICIYECIYVCMYVYLNIYMCVCVHIFICFCIYVLQIRMSLQTSPKKSFQNNSDFGRKVVEQKSDNFLIHVTLTWLPGSIHLASGIIQKWVHSYAQCLNEKSCGTGLRHIQSTFHLRASLCGLYHGN